MIETATLNGVACSQSGSIANRARTSEWVACSVWFDREARPDVLRNPPRPPAPDIHENPIRTGLAEKRAVRDASDGSPSDAARRGHARHPRIDREPLPCESRAYVFDLVRPHDPDLAPLEIGALIEPRGCRMGERGVQHPAQVDQVAGVAELVDVLAPHLDEVTV